MRQQGNVAGLLCHDRLLSGALVVPFNGCIETCRRCAMSAQASEWTKRGPDCRRGDKWGWVDMFKAATRPVVTIRLSPAAAD